MITLVNSDRIDQYMRDQKLVQIKGVPTALPYMGLEDDMFDDFSMSPEDMDLQVVEPSNFIWDTCINMISSHSNMTSTSRKQDCKTCSQRNEYK